MDRHHPQPADVERGSWSSLDRFAAKRLRTIADELVPAKRAVIEEKSAFRALLNVSPFNIPNEFIEFVAANTSFQLREFRFNKKRIVFTRDMVKKVFGIRCGNKPVILLKKSDQCELRDVYYRAGSNRAPIRIAVELLKSCEVTDEATIIRTWDLICLATVVDPGSGNMLSLEYLGSMFDPTKTHEFAWDEHMLELAMQEVKKIQHKKAQPLVLEKGATKFEFWISGPFAMLAIVYMDHLQFPPNEHTINYSVPRVCYVKNEDLKFVVTNDLERKILNNTTIFGRRPFLDILDTPYGVEDPITEPDEEVNPSASLNEWLSFPSSQDMEIPPRFKHLHDKHMGIFSADVDAAMKSLGTGLKQMQSQRMTALLIDVDAAMKGAAGSNVEFTTTRDAASEEQEKAQEAEVLHAKARGAVDDVKEQETSQEAKVVDAEEHLPAATDSEVCTLNITDPPQTAVILDSWTIVGGAAERSAVNSPVRSPERSSPRRGISDEAWNNAPDAPSMDLFPEESEEFKDFNSIPDSPSHICVEMTGTACNDKGKAAIELSEVASLKEGPETGGVSEAAKDVEATVDLSKDATPQDPCCNSHQQ